MVSRPKKGERARLRPPKRYHRASRPKKMVDDRSSRLGLVRSFKSNAIREIKNENYLQYRDYKVLINTLSKVFIQNRLVFEFLGHFFPKKRRNVSTYIYSL